MVLQIGSTVWKFDQNYRVYNDGEPGPVYREHFRPHKIIDETSRSWVLDNYKRTKVNKKSLAGVYVFQEEIDQQCWIKDNLYRIVTAVRQCRKYDTLRQVEAIVAKGE